MKTSNIVNKVIEDLKYRDKGGQEYYGTSMDREDLSEKEWLQHLYEELLDASLYIKKLQNMPEKKIINAQEKRVTIDDIIDSLEEEATLDGIFYSYTQVEKAMKQYAESKCREQCILCAQNAEAGYVITDNPDTVTGENIEAYCLFESIAQAPEPKFD